MSQSLLTEVDDDDAPYDGGQDTTHVDIPDGLSGGGQPRQNGRQPSEPDYQIVETDEDFKPLERQQPSEIRAEDQRQDDARPQRQTKADRRAAQRQARDRTEGELRAYREQNERLQAELAAFRGDVTPRLERIDEARFTDQISSIDREIAQQAQVVTAAARRMSDAVTSGDSDAHHAALQDHTLAVEKGRDLAAHKRSLESERTQPRRPTEERREEQPARRPQVQPRVDPEVSRRTRDFAAKHSWLDLQNPSDRETRRAIFIDDEVRADGYDPRDDDYWEELEDRLKEVLPHRFQAPQRQRQQSQQPQRRGPMVAGAGADRPTGGPRKVLLSPERKAALMEAGALDRDGQIADRVRFNRLAAGYEKYDRDNGVGMARQ